MTPLQMRKAVAVALRLAADHMEKHGWWDGKRRVGGAALCTSQALRHLVETHQITLEAGNAAERLVVHFTGYHGIPSWNDEHSKATPVLVKLRMMADLAEAGEDPHRYQELMRPRMLHGCACETCIEDWRNIVLHTRLRVPPSQREMYCRDAHVKLVHFVPKVPDQVPAAWVAEMMTVPPLNFTVADLVSA